MERRYLLLIVVFLTIFADCQAANCDANNTMFVCITSEPSSTSCQPSSNLSMNINSMSRSFLPDYPRACITVFLTNELHSLGYVLYFPAHVTHIEIVGLSPVKLASIECANNSGLEFGAVNGFVRIANTVFKNCGLLREIPTISGRNLVALFFNNNSYELDHVTLQSCGNGVFAYQSWRQVITNCKFLDNDKGHLKIIDTFFLIIKGTLFHNGSSVTGAGIQMVSTSYSTSISIEKSIFRMNRARNGSNFDFFNYKGPFSVSISLSTAIHIEDCVFTQTVSIVNDSFGVQIHSVSYLDRRIINVTILRSNFTDNENGGIVIYNAKSVSVDQCIFANNKGTGLQVTKQKIQWFERTEKLQLLISRVLFVNNTIERALVLFIMVDDYDTDRAETLISDCMFMNNLFQSDSEYQTPLTAVYIEGNTDYYYKYAWGGIGYGYHKHNMITMHECKFQNNNHGSSGNCSGMYLRNADNVTLDNVTFAINSCSGIILEGTFMRIRNKLNITQNSARSSGGALYLQHSYLLYNSVKALPPITKFSRIIFHLDGYLHASKNTALEYGGAIYTDEACDFRDVKMGCFFQFESKLDNVTSRLNFVKNQARMGGDAIYGGCLSNCSINSDEIVDIRDEGNIIWDIVSSSGDDRSQSEFAEHPYRVFFCENETISNISHATCLDTAKTTVYRGEIFTVQMMAAGTTCSPSSFVIIAKVSQGSKYGIRIGKEQGIKQSHPYCSEYSFSLLSEDEDYADEFSLEVVLTLLKENSHLTTPASLTVEYKNYCPLGFKLDQFHEKCICTDLITSNGILCNTDYSLTVPALTWIGVWQGYVAVGPYCQHCKTNKEVIPDTSNSSDNLCAFRRRGFLCGECMDGYSIKLGGYKCDDCSKYNRNGILLTIAFAIVGFLLTFLLLRLNFTTSTGLINALIFYSNIIYSSHEVFLPISRESNNANLDNLVHFLYIFQAWINLDFGFDVCYFHQIDTYMITWLQFAFPIYIWLIIFVIVVVSRYSTAVSKFTGHNTISVLATLLLLSFTKLLSAILSSSSYTQLYLVNGKKSHPLWSSDANVRYLTGKHIGLFLMSVFMIVIYILPFTFIVTFGPLLQASSNRSILKGMMKIRPFLDAFYGPYTVHYRYWPGFLLLLRVFHLSIFAFFFPG